MHLEKNLETLSEQILCLTAQKQAKVDLYESLSDSQLAYFLK